MIAPSAGSLKPSSISARTVNVALVPAVTMDVDIPASIERVGRIVKDTGVDLSGSLMALGTDFAAPTAPYPDGSYPNSTKYCSPF